MLLGFYVGLAIGVPLALGTFVRFNALHRSRRCPRCASDTIRLRSRRHRLLGWIVRQDLQLRWCPACGWQATVRRYRSRTPRPITVARPIDGAPRRPDRTPPEGLGIRSIRIDGVDWQVRVQCWAEQGAWRGRLVFRGPAGRSWCEEEPGFSGGSAVDVIARALSLSDRSLAGRIRAALPRTGESGAPDSLG